MRLARSVDSHRSSESSQTGSSSFGQTPATAAQTSICPSASRVSAKSRSTCASSVRSPPTIGQAPELCRDGLGPLAAAVVVDRDARALGRERADARRADPTGAAGDENALSGEPRVHARRIISAPCAST